VNAPSFEIKWPPDPKSLSNHHALLSAKFNDVRLDGELHKPAGIAFVADVVNTCDKFTERPGSLRGFGFHNPKSKRENRIDVMGCLPHVCFSQKNQDTNVMA